MWRFLRAVVVGCGVAVAITPAPARSQQAVQMAPHHASDVLARAESLERLAASLYDERDQYARAAKLHLEAAELREPGDLQRVRDLELAGRLFYYAGNKGRAFQLTQRAGDEALLMGDVLSAAQNLLDAASIAHERRRSHDVLRLVERVRLLTNSPLLATQDRDWILKRLS